MTDADERKIEWESLWGFPVPEHISHPMFEKSLVFKRMERAGAGLDRKQQEKLNNLVQAFRKFPQAIKRDVCLKPGTRLVKTWRGKRYSVDVTQDGFMWEGKAYSSLSEVASKIAGTRWNGWVFFGLKKSKSEEGSK